MRISRSTILASKSRIVVFAWMGLLVALSAPDVARAQFIDFETLPGGAPTVDLQEITTEYAIHGVTFTLLDRNTGLPIGAPRIAKAGPPQTAFQGCTEDDTPGPHLDFGTSFLTDGSQLGVEGDLLIEYATPVAHASGVILDIDCRIDGGSNCEQWTITAFDAGDAVLDVVILDGPPGGLNPECDYPEAGPGEAEAFGWVVDTGTAQISSIILRYTGIATDVGLAFDHFSVAGTPGPPTVTAASPADTVCAGESLDLTAVVTDGIPPYAFQWQREFAPSIWTNLGTASTQTIQPLVTSQYRVVVTDAAASSATSAPVTVIILPDDPLCATGLIVSSYHNDRVVRYSFRSRLPSIFVPTGSGGLNGTSALICADDHELYVSSQDNDRILRFDGATGAFQTIFVAAGSAGLNIPVGLDFGPDGNLYVASYLTHSVYRYDGGNGTPIDTFIPSGSGLNGPSGLIFGPDDDLYVSSFLGHKVLRFDGTSGAPLGDFVTAGSGGLNSPRGLEFGPDGHLYVAEQYNDSVRRFNGTTGNFMDIFVSSGSGGLDRANDLAFGPDGVLYVTSFNNDQVLRYDGANGTFLDALPNDYLDGPGWIAIGCEPFATAVPGAHPPPLALSVEPGVPNPFNPRTTVGFTVAVPAHTRVRVMDLTGRVVVSLLDRQLAAGRHTVEWDGRTEEGRAASSGVYFVSVECGTVREGAKVVLLR